MAGLATVFGSGAMSNNIADIEHNQAMLVIGSNTTETHPVIGLRMRKAVRQGAQLIVADPRRIPLVDDAVVWLRHRPGTDAALINALCHVIIREDLTDKAFIETRTENFAAFAAAVTKYTPEWAQTITGVPAAEIEKAARILGRAERAGIYYTMGITQHTSGTNNVFALANLALATGNLGKQGAGLNPLRGQNNVQGASDMGCVPVYLPGYQRVDDEEARAKFEKLWGTSLSATPGLTATEMTQAMTRGKIASLWIMGENPLLSDPHTRHVREAFAKLEFLVVQDLFLTETAAMADVVLPAVSFAEKNGTFTNTERRVQRVRQALSSPGEAKDDLTIINLVASRMQYGHDITPAQRFSSYRHGGERAADSLLPQAEQIFAEMGQAWAAIAGINYQRLDDDGLQWPCPTVEHAGTPVLFEHEFPRGKALFTVVEWQGPNEITDQDYPLILTTGRVLCQYHTGTMTRRSPEIEEADRGPHVEINPADAARIGISDSEMVIARSRRGHITLPAYLTDKVATGVVFIPFHYHEAAANLLTNDALDPISKIPEAKVCAIRIEKAV